MLEESLVFFFLLGASFGDVQSRQRYEVEHDTHPMSSYRMLGLGSFSFVGICLEDIHMPSMRVLAKYGVEPSGCVELAKHVKMVCPNLIFSGLMTIGMLDYSSTPENFKALLKCRTEVCEALGILEEQCELSMGMSADFEQAIEMGSTNVRIGSTIFGPRVYPNKDKFSETKSGIS